MVPDFKKLNDKDKLIFMLSSENEIAILISRFLTESIEHRDPVSLHYRVKWMIPSPRDKNAKERVP